MTLDEITMERLLHAVSPELRGKLKEQEPKTAEELESLANLHAQSRKGPACGRHVSINKRLGFIHQKQLYPKKELSSQEQGQEQEIRERSKPVPIYIRRNTRPVITCYK